MRHYVVLGLRTCELHDVVGWYTKCSLFGIHNTLMACLYHPPNRFMQPFLPGHVSYLMFSFESRLPTCLSICLFFYFLTCLSDCIQVEPITRLQKLSKAKAFADDKFNVTENIIY